METSYLKPQFPLRMWPEFEPVHFLGSQDTHRAHHPTVPWQSLVELVLVFVMYSINVVGVSFSVCFTSHGERQRGK